MDAPVRRPFDKPHIAGTLHVTRKLLDSRLEPLDRPLEVKGVIRAAGQPHLLRHDPAVGLPVGNDHPGDVESLPVLDDRPIDLTTSRVEHLSGIPGPRVRR